MNPPHGRGSDPGHRGHRVVRRTTRLPRSPDARRTKSRSSSQEYSRARPHTGPPSFFSRLPRRLRRLSTPRRTPRLATRNVSSKARRGSWRNSRVVTSATTSKDRSGNGSADASPRTQDDEPRERARASIAGERSRPTTRSPNRPSQRVQWPVPHPTSRSETAPGNSLRSLLRTLLSKRSARRPSCAYQPSYWAATSGSSKGLRAGGGAEVRLTTLSASAGSPAHAWPRRRRDPGSSPG